MTWRMRARQEKHFGLGVGLAGINSTEISSPAAPAQGCGIR